MTQRYEAVGGGRTSVRRLQESLSAASFSVVGTPSWSVEGITDRNCFFSERANNIWMHCITRCSAIAERPPLQGALVLAKSGRLKLGDNTLRTL